VFCDLDPSQYLHLIKYAVYRTKPEYCFIMSVFQFQYLYFTSLLLVAQKYYNYYYYKYNTSNNCYNYA